MPRAVSARRRAAPGLGVVGVCAALAIGSVYGLCPVHRFPAPTAFAGPRWYDPYATGHGQWRKANLHAHTRAWAGLTNGRDDADALVRRYAALGYDVAAVSDYQRLSHPAGPAASALAVYEQGYNLRKAHLLVLGAHAVAWRDYPLLQTRDELQDRIDRLRGAGAAVVLAHPRLRGAITDADLRALTGYAALEVASSTTDGESAWDVALTAGRPVWGIGSDDTHDAANLTRTARVWTLIDAASTAPADLLDAIRAGRTIVVRGTRGQSDVALRAQTMRGDTLCVALDRPATVITVVGSGGRVLARLYDTSVARVVLAPRTTYARVVVHTPATTLYLAPVLRSATGALPAAPAATPDRAETWLRRTVLLLAGCCVGVRRRAA